MNQCIRLLIFVSIGVFAAGCSEPAKVTDTAKPDPWAALSDSERELLRHGEARARSCAACHGPQGISRNRMYPSIAGMSAEDMTTALKAYRSGDIVNPLMSPQARGLSDDDIAALAFYFTQQQVD
ncbi:c-type cytochrome [Alkalimonas amylolytica]|uniref:Cytochrome C oxidase, cbb3-type, subunit III n=1 Tax=Alkalimonas amylolytica TaxID=152573 RepID=A0A1H4FG95_ALKAM|nr:c-type cytochrome [Alkalimonas amylolytica]SEA96181.1 Cytochrome C oxidase, cbb3-type, subunit III [Alkalimonas amylolytica]